MAIKSNYEEILKRLVQMQHAPHYATGRRHLVLAEQAIVELETALQKALAAQPAQQEPVPLTDDELDVCRQWFGSVQDTNVDYLNAHDYAIAGKLYLHLGLRVPDSVKHAIPPAAAPAPVQLADEQIDAA